jgi:hypothetical protein
MKLFCCTILLMLGLAAITWASPTTAFWTPCCMDIQPAGATHITLDNYSTIGKDNGEDFPTDYGLTYGFKLSPTLLGEVGFDLLEPTDDPLYLNAKFGVSEGSLSPQAPGLALGIYNVGTKQGVTDQDIVYLVAGKTLPNKMGRLHFGGYWGNDKLLKDAAGNTANKGWMIAWDRTLIANKLSVIADYASGKNAVGGGGVGLSFLFNKDVALLVGPVWFNEKAINGDMKWSTQVDINF